MRVRRFKVDDLTGATARLEGQEATHALRVLRLKPGDEVLLFDGRGAEARGIIRSANKSRLDVEIVGRCPPSPRNGHRLILAVAPPKGDRADWLVEQCSELGVSAIWPLHLVRSSVVPSEAKITRWRRKAVQAAKQAGQAVTTVVEAVRRLQEALAGAPPGARIWIADPRPSAPLFSVVLAAHIQADQPAPCDLVFVGPEGGFTQAEQSAVAAAGGRPVRLCAPILRVETAAVAVAAIWASWAAQQRPHAADAACVGIEENSDTAS